VAEFLVRKQESKDQTWYDAQVKMATDAANANRRQTVAQRIEEKFADCTIDPEYNCEQTVDGTDLVFRVATEDVICESARSGKSVTTCKAYVKGIKLNGRTYYARITIGESMKTFNLA